MVGQMEKMNHPALMVDFLLEQERHVFGIALGKVPMEVVPGDELASREIVQWAAKRTKRCHFDGFMTYPQQDMKKDGSGIKIKKVTDCRAQPWNEMVRANIHDTAVSVETLPSENATVQEVREWAFFVLAQRKYAKWVDMSPWLVCVTLMNWNRDGAALRKAKKWSQWKGQCPKSYINVDKELCHISSQDRMKVDKALYETISSLFAEEKTAIKENKQASAKRSKEEKKLFGKVQQTLLKKLLCFGRKSAPEIHSDDELPAYSKIDLPQYTEKQA